MNRRDFVSRFFGMLGLASVPLAPFQEKLVEAFEKRSAEDVPAREAIVLSRWAVSQVIDKPGMTIVVMAASYRRAKAFVELCHKEACVIGRNADFYCDGDIASTMAMKNKVMSKELHIGDSRILCRPMSAMDSLETCRQNGIRMDALIVLGPTQISSPELSACATGLLATCRSPVEYLSTEEALVFRQRMSGDARAVTSSGEISMAMKNLETALFPQGSRYFYLSGELMC